MPKQDQRTVATRGPSGQRRRRGRNAEPADWANAAADNLRSAVVAVTRAGCAIRFGYSRDGSAYAVGILGDGDPYTEWVRPGEDINEWLTELVLDWLGEPPSPEAPDSP